MSRFPRLPAQLPDDEAGLGGWAMGVLRSCYGNTYGQSRQKPPPAARKLPAGKAPPTSPATKPLESATRSSFTAEFHGPQLTTLFVLSGHSRIFSSPDGRLPSFPSGFEAPGQAILPFVKSLLILTVSVRFHNSFTILCDARWSEGSSGTGRIKRSSGRRIRSEREDLCTG